MSDAPGKRRVLVLGATGGIGGETASALLRHGWEVIAMARDPSKERAEPGSPLAKAKWVAGDAMNAGDVRRAAEGVQAIVHAVNPPGYRNWGVSIGFETGPPIGSETGPLWRRRLSPSGGAVRSRRRRAAPHCQAARYPLRSGSSVAS